MKKILILFIILGQMIFAQTATLDLENGRKDGTKYKFDVSITRTSTWGDGTGLSNYLGSSSFRFSYNSIGLSMDPTVSEVGPQFPSDYTFASSIVSGQINVEVNYSFDFNSSAMAEGSKYLLFTISITILDENQLAGITWIPASTSVFDGKDENVLSTLNGDLNAQPLPVELSSFSVSTIEGTKAQLNWETATEVNNYGFEIERTIAGSEKSKVKSQADASTSLSMTDNLKWEKVAFIEGHGNSNSKKSYSYTDKNLVGGSKFMYRLKQIDIDGKFEYSDVVEIEVLPNKYELLQNYPNPFNPETNIKFSLPKDAKIAIKIYNILGEKVATLLNEELKAGFHKVNFNTNSAGYKLSSGVYIYTIETTNFSQVKKMILMK